MKIILITLPVLLLGVLGAQTWNYIGAPGGRIQSLSINPNNPNSVIVSNTTGGLFQSIDYGQSISYIAHQFRDYNIYNIIQINDSQDSFYCYGDNTGYFKVNIPNDSWKLINDESSWGGGFTINPLNNDIIYISKNERQFWRSVDGGNMWSQLHTFNENLRIIEVSQSDTSIIYVAVDNAIYKSNNSGKDWTKVSAENAFSGRPYKLVINPLNNNSLFLHSEGSFLKSTNGGLSFDSLFIGNVYTFAVNTIDTLTLYVGTGDPVFAPDGGIIKSIDGGLNWFELRNGLPDGILQCNRLEINPLNPDEIYAAITDYGVYRTTDAGGSWHLTNLSNKEVLNFHLFNNYPERIITTQYGWGFLFTVNNGSSWYYPNLDPEIHFYDPLPFQVAINPENSNLGFIGGITSLYKTTNGGIDWYSTDQIPGAWYVEYNPYNSSTIFLYANNDYGNGGHYRSIDGGDTWEKLENSNYMPANSVYSPHHFNVIFGHGYSWIDDEFFVAKSSDNGETWEPKTEGLIRISEIDKLSEVYSLAISYADSNILYCGQSGGLSKSIDGGENWSRVDSSLDVHDYFRVSSILLDEKDPNRIFIGTLSSGIPFTASFDNGGLYLSEDDCQSWTKVYDGEISLIKADRSVPRNIYINTQYGILTAIDTITKLNRDNSSSLPKGYHLYQNYPNPFNPETKIKYNLSKNSNVKIDIFNLQGQIVTTLVNSAFSAGSYTIIFNASNFPSGVYFYKIVAGEFSDVKRMVLVK